MGSLDSTAKSGSSSSWTVRSGGTSREKEPEKDVALRESRFPFLTARGAAGLGTGKMTEKQTGRHKQTLLLLPTTLVVGCRATSIAQQSQLSVSHFPLPSRATLHVVRKGSLSGIFDMAAIQKSV